MRRRSRDFIKHCAPPPHSIYYFYFKYVRLKPQLEVNAEKEAGGSRQMEYFVLGFVQVMLCF